MAEKQEKRRSLTLQNKGLKRLQKPKSVEKKQSTEDELWGRLTELNPRFAKIKKAKKNGRKIKRAF